MKEIDGGFSSSAVVTFQRHSPDIRHFSVLQVVTVAW